ncbi:MAG: DNA/RNA non-specific endonuclease [Rikenellaceae bacterium]
MSLSSSVEYIKCLWRWVLVTLLLVVTLSCSEGGDDSGGIDAYFNTSNIVGGSSGTTAIMISGRVGAQYGVTIQSDESSWIGFDSSYKTTSKSGVLGDGVTTVFLYYKSNDGYSEREATITITYEDGGERELIFTQYSVNQSPVYSWAELPEINEDDGYLYANHFTTLNSTTVRNFSLCYDTTKKVALWVAYPLHSIYTSGTGVRTNDWAYDPSISVSYQPQCVSYSYKGNYDRGHQIASADRLGNDDMNAQTFYMTNMTPQNGDLNSGMWANLESKVRGYSCTDTLYVVTGAYFDRSRTPSYTEDGNGNQVEIPTHYYKALLRTRTGRTGKGIEECSTSELKSIGFWVENVDYSNTSVTSSICCTVDYIEDMCGFNLFPLIPEEVEQQNVPSDWGI